MSDVFFSEHTLRAFVNYFEYFGTPDQRISRSDLQTYLIDKGFPSGKQSIDEHIDKVRSALCSQKNVRRRCGRSMELILTNIGVLPRRLFLCLMLTMDNLRSESLQSCTRSSLIMYEGNCQLFQNQKWSAMYVSTK